MSSKNIIIEIKKTFKENAIITTIIAMLWLVLGWLKSFGVNSILLFPLNFLSGALNGVDGGSFVGGIIGKTILLMILNSFVRPLFFNNGNKEERIKNSYKVLKNSAVSKIPQYGNIKQLFVKDPSKLCYNIIGFGLAFLIYPFITGNGSFQNSGVCLLLSIAMFKEIKKQRGLIVTVINSLLKKKGKKQVNKDGLNRLISGNGLGFACTVMFSAINGDSILSYNIGGLFIVIGLLIMVFVKLTNKTEVKVA